MAQLKDTEINGNLYVSEDVQIGDLSVSSSLNDLASRILHHFKITYAADFRYLYGDSSLPGGWGYVLSLGYSVPNQSGGDTYYLYLGDTGLYHGVQLNGATQVTWVKAT